MTFIIQHQALALSDGFDAIMAGAFHWIGGAMDIAIAATEKMS